MLSPDLLFPQDLCLTGANGIPSVATTPPRSGNSFPSQKGLCVFFFSRRCVTKSQVFFFTSGFPRSPRPGARRRRKKERKAGRNELANVLSNFLFGRVTEGGREEVEEEKRKKGGEKNFGSCFLHARKSNSQKGGYRACQMKKECQVGKSRSFSTFDGNTRSYKWQLDFLPSQPPTMVCKMEAQLEYVHVVCS